MINIATCGIIPLYKAFEDTWETGSDEAMQAIGGTAVGLVPVTRVLGPLVRPFVLSRPVRPAGLGPPKELGLPRNVCTLDIKDPATNYTTRIYVTFQPFAVIFVGKGGIFPERT